MERGQSLVVHAIASGRSCAKKLICFYKENLSFQMLEGISGINYRKLELKMSNIKISINQINTKVGSLYSNTEKIIEKITGAIKNECDIVCFPD